MHVTSPSGAGGGRIEPIRRDSGGFSSRYALAHFGRPPPPGAPLNAGSDAPTSLKQSLGEVTRPILSYNEFG